MPMYDEAARRKSVRKGRERGCWVYIPAEQLREAGRYDEGTAPRYRVWASRRRRSGSVVVTLYAGEQPEHEEARKVIYEDGTTVPKMMQILRHPDGSRTDENGRPVVIEHEKSAETGGRGRGRRTAKVSSP